LKQPDDHFADDSTSDGSQAQALFHDLGFLENIIPERCRFVQVETKILQFVEITARECG